MSNLRQAAQQALEAMDKATRFMSDSDYKKLNQAIDDLRAALAEPEQEPVASQELTPIYLAEVTMPDPLVVGYILDDGPWCKGAAWCLDCHHEWVAVWPLGAESLECPACGSTDTDREQAVPHKRKGGQHG